jgi:RNA polymerase sigma-70 factor (ECF subfamily)
LQPVVALLQEDTAGRPNLRETDPQPNPEQALVEACREGRASAFEELYREHGGRMKSVARNLLGNTTDAEDAVQEAFLKLYRGLPGFKGEAALGSWLYRILVNTCFDMGRKRTRRAENPQPDPRSEPSFDPPAQGADPALRLTLERTLGELPRLPRSVFVLYEVEGFKHREIAEILGIAEGTSKHALFAARKELQTRILASRRRRQES